MIDDIVELPRRLLKFKDGGVLTSLKPYGLPESKLEMLTGFSSDHRDDDVVGLGNEFRVLTGSSCPYRYKFIENTPDAILEYFAVADAPITSMYASIFTLWCTKVDKETLRAIKRYNWINIRKAAECLHNVHSMTLSELVQSNMQLMATLHGAPGLGGMYMWAHMHPLAVSAEDAEILRMLSLNENLKTFENAWEFGYLEPCDMFRGIPLTEPTKKKGSSWSNKVLCGNVVSPRDIKKLLSPRIPTRPFHQCVRNIQDPTKGADLSGESINWVDWFDVLKYIELIPYGEFFVSLSFPDNGIDAFTVYNSYDPGTKKDYSSNDIDTYVRKILDKLIECFDFDKFEPTKLYIYRSWSEEVYITIQNGDNERATTRLYFDMAYAAVGSRMFYADEYL